MSDEKKPIREFFIEKAEKMVEVYGKDLEGKVPIDLLVIVRFDDGNCRVLHPKDRIIRLGLMEDLKLVMKEL